MKAIGYVRVSTNEQAKNGVSLDLQARKIRQYAELKEIELLDIKADEGKTAKNMHREGLQNVIKAVQNREVDAVVIYKLDRLTRSLKDLNYLIELFNKNNVSLCSIKDSLDTKTANGRMVINLLGTISQWERETVAERTSEALQELKAEGRRYGQIPFGKMVVCGRLTNNPQEQEIIAEIKALKSKGYSYREIAEVLNGKGYTTRQQTLFKKQTVYSLYAHLA